MNDKTKKISERDEGIEIPSTPSPLEEIKKSVEIKGERELPPPPSPVRISEEELPYAPGHEKAEEKPKETKSVEDKKQPEVKPEIKIEKPEKEGPGEEHYPDTSISPPLFIKVDKYTELVKDIQKLKSISLALRDALDALSDVEKELVSGISLAHKTLDDFNQLLSNLDSKLLRVHTLEETPIDTKEVDEYIKNVYNQIEKIKQELKMIKK